MWEEKKDLLKTFNNMFKAKFIFFSFKIASMASIQKIYSNNSWHVLMETICVCVCVCVCVKIHSISSNLGST